MHTILFFMLGIVIAKVLWSGVMNVTNAFRDGWDESRSSFLLTLGLILITASIVATWYMQVATYAITGSVILGGLWLLINGMTKLRTHFDTKGRDASLTVALSLAGAGLALFALACLLPSYLLSIGGPALM